MTLNQILKLIKSVALNHSQVNSYLFSKDWDFESEGVVTYPLIGCALVAPAAFVNNSLEFDLTMYVADLVHKDRSNEIEVLSDTIQIAQDVVAVLDSPAYDDDIINTSAINYLPFTEKWDSEVSGWTFDLKVKVPSQKDWCQVPTKS